MHLLLHYLRLVENEVVLLQYVQLSGLKCVKQKILLITLILPSTGNKNSWSLVATI